MILFIDIRRELFYFAIILLLIGGEFLYSCSYMLNFLLHSYHVQEHTKLTHAWYDLNVSAQFLLLFSGCHILRGSISICHRFVKGELFMLGIIFYMLWFIFLIKLPFLWNIRRERSIWVSFHNMSFKIVLVCYFYWLFLS